MRKKYEKPCMNMENFEANEYIAACWSATCNVPYLTGYTKQNSSILNTGYAKLNNSDDKLHGYGCNESHVIKTEGDKQPVSNGSWTTVNNVDIFFKPDHEYNGGVYIWQKGNWFKSTHFTKEGTWSKHERPNHS